MNTAPATPARRGGADRPARGGGVKKPNSKTTEQYLSNSLAIGSASQVGVVAESAVADFATTKTLPQSYKCQLPIAKLLHIWFAPGTRARYCISGGE